MVKSARDIRCRSGLWEICPGLQSAHNSKSPPSNSRTPVLFVRSVGQGHTLTSVPSNAMPWLQPWVRVQTCQVGEYDEAFGRCWRCSRDFDLFLVVEYSQPSGTAIVAGLGLVPFADGLPATPAQIRETDRPESWTALKHEPEGELRPIPVRGIAVVDFTEARAIRRKRRPQSLPPLRPSRKIPPHLDARRHRTRPRWTPSRRRP